MNIQYKLIPPGSKNRPDSRKVGFITIHETDNTTKGADAEAHAKYLATTKDSVSWHYSVSGQDVICHVPPGETAWHSGKTEGNQFSIGIEMCVNSNGDYEQTLKTTAELVRELMQGHSVPIEKVVQHNYWTGKNCPRRLRESGRWEDFRILYWDKPKKTTAVRDYANGGFFGVYKEGGINFTLPVANLVADIDESQVYTPALKYLKEWGRIEGGKFYCDCRRNTSSQFKNKAPSTFLIDTQGNTSVHNLSALPHGIRYAISGAPVIIGGKDTSWSKDVLPQGWLADITRATWHTLLGLKDDYVVTIGMQTTTSNCIQSSEAYNKLKGYGFTDVILLDGGRSFVFDSDGKNVAMTSENRRVNTLIF